MVDDFLLIPGSQLEIIQGEEGSLPQEHIAQAFASRQDHVLHNAGPSRRLGKIRAVFFQELYSGERCRWDASDILGVANPEKIPDWAKEKLREYEKKRTEPKKDRGEAR